MAVAVTHADVEMKPRQRCLRGRLGTSIIMFCIFMGITSFVLCLIAETTRSEVIWEYVPELVSAKHVQIPQCQYTSDGTATLGYAAGGLLAVVIALAVGQAFMGLELCNPASHSFAHSSMAWISSSISPESLRWQAATFFILSWVSFAVTAVLLLIGISVEASHILDHKGLHSHCLVVGQGQFAAAGVFALASTFLGVAFYIAALTSLRLNQTQGERARMEIFDGSLLPTSGTDDVYAVPPPVPDSLQREPPMCSLHTRISLKGF